MDCFASLAMTHGSSTSSKLVRCMISFIKGMTKDTEGKTLRVGRRAATAEARITDAKGRLLAHATTTCLVFEIPKGT